MDRKLRFRNLAMKEGPLVVVQMRKPLRAVYLQVADRPIPYKHGENRRRSVQVWDSGLTPN